MTQTAAMLAPIPPELEPARSYNQKQRDSCFGPRSKGLDGAALEVYRQVMILHPYTGSSNYLARIFVGLALDLPVQIAHPGKLDRNNLDRVFRLFQDAQQGAWHWDDAARDVACEYGIKL